MTDRLHLEAGSAEVAVDVVHGGRLASFAVDGLELLRQGSPGVPLGWGCFPMVPWAGRLRHGRFRFHGVDVEVPVDLAPHAIHGFGYTSAWDAVSADRLTLDLRDHWPFGGRVDQHIDLTADRLLLDLTVRAGDRPMPAMLGWHPWFQWSLGAGGELCLDLRADGAYLLGNEAIPTGAVGPVPLEPWDHCFHLVDQPVRLDWPGALALELRSSCDHWVVFTEPDDALCVEPQTAAPDVFNRGPNVLAPGEALTAWFEMRWTLP